MRMAAEFHHLQTGLLMAFGSWGTVGFFVLMRESRGRFADLDANLRGAYLWQASWMLAWILCLLLVFSRLHLGAAPTSPLGHSLVGGPLLLAAYPVFLVDRILGRRLEPLGLSRGALFTGIHKVAGKARFQTLSIYLLPNDSQPRLPVLLGHAVLIPRRFLDCMSRAEIDALAARQLARLQRAYSRPVNDVLLVGALAAVGLCELLRPGMAGWWLLFAGLVAVETAALALNLPLAEMQSDLRAIALTGNPDAFFSALGESARLNGVTLDLPALEKTAQRAGVSPDRLRALLEPQPRPAEDRYPTSGDYATVGF
jgi:hypothetical protein